MSVRTPEPRLPLEPEEYPLYKPPSRMGCSGLTIVTLITVFAFAFLFSRVTPDMAKAITDFPERILSSSTPETTPGAGAVSTQTAVTALPTDTPVPPPPPPPRHCMQVVGTGGSGVALREQPRTNARNLVPGNARDGAIFEVIGADVTSGKDAAGNDIVWKNVQLLPPDNRAGFVLAKFLQDVPCP